MFIIIIQEIRSRFYTIINPKLVLYIKREVEIIGIRCCLTFWILLRTFRGVISCMILDQPKDPLLEYSKDYRYSVHLSRIIEKSRFNFPIPHTVRNVHFLSKNSTLISRENCRFFLVKTRENVVALDFLAVDNFDFTRKIVKKILGEKLVKMLGFCQN